MKILTHLGIDRRTADKYSRVKKIKGKFHPRTGHADPEGEQSYSSTVSLTSALDGSGWLTPRSGRFIPGKRPDTHFVGGWVGPRAGLDEYGKILSHRDSISGPSSLQRVSIPTDLSRSTFKYNTILIQGRCKGFSLTSICDSEKHDLLFSWYWKNFPAVKAAGT